MRRKGEDGLNQFGLTLSTCKVSVGLVFLKLTYLEILSGVQTGVGTRLAFWVPHSIPVVRTTFGADVNLVDLELYDLDHWSQADSDVPQSEDGSAEVATKNGVVLKKYKA